jgi:hypothetical protein
MNIFSLPKEHEEELKWNKALSRMPVSNSWWFHWKSPVHALVHWVELRYFLYTTKYFKYLNYIFFY